MTPDEIMLVLWDAVFKSALLLALASVAALALRRASAAVRHLVWSVAACGALLLPMLSIVLPEWRVPWVPDWRQPVLSMNAVKEMPAPVPEAPVSPRNETMSNRVEPGNIPPSVPVEATSQPSTPQAIHAKPPQPEQPGGFIRWLPHVWFAGAVLSALPLMLGWLQVVRLSRRSQPVTDPEWLELLDVVSGELRLRRCAVPRAGSFGVRRLVGAFCRRDLSRRAGRQVAQRKSADKSAHSKAPCRVRLRLSAHTKMPMTWGAWRPILLLPMDAGEWSPERRRVVLLHELAHVKRLDWLTQTLAYLACALYWFNPLVWFAARRMRIEREQACDDLVLHCGSRPSDYADELLKLAAGMSGQRLLNWAAVPMARRSSLEARLLSILDQKRSRTALTRMAVIAALALLAAIAVPVAMMKAGAGTDQSNEMQTEVVVWQAIVPGELVRQLGITNRFGSENDYSTYAVDGSRLRALCFESMWNHSDIEFGERLQWLTPRDAKVGGLRTFDILSNIQRKESPEITRQTATMLFHGAYEFAPHGSNVAMVLRFTVNAQLQRLKSDFSGHEVSETKPPHTSIEWQSSVSAGQALCFVARLAGAFGGDSYHVAVFQTVTGRAEAARTRKTLKEAQFMTANREGYTLSPSTTTAANTIPTQAEALSDSAKGTIFAAANALVAAQQRNSAPTLTSITGIFTDPQFRSALVATEKRDGTDLVSAPTVVNKVSVLPAQNLGAATLPASSSSRREEAPSESQRPEAGSQTPGQEWGEPVEGVQVRLQADQTFWELPDIPSLAASVRNRNVESFSVVQTQQSGELEVDGIWHRWAHPYDVNRKSLASGAESGAIRITANAWWGHGTARLVAGPGKHTIRFAVHGSLGGSNDIRVVSNLVEVELHWPAQTVASLARQTNTAASPSPAASSRTYFSGRVVDDETDQPITDFAVQWGAENPRGQQEIIGWKESYSGPSQAGRFWADSYERGMIWARVLATGYRPQPVTVAPVFSPARVENLVVRLERSGDLRGIVLDHAGKPMAGMRVFVAGTQRLELTDGRPGRFGGTGWEFKGGHATTDAAGRFVVPAGDGTEQTLAVASADGQMISATPIVDSGRETKITLPRPATLIVRYDIPEDSPEVQLELRFMTTELDRAIWKNVSSVLNPKLGNGDEIALTNLAPGTYEFARNKKLNAEAGARDASFDRRTIVIEEGQIKRVNLVRTSGFSLRGELVGLKEAEVSGAYLYVRSAEATGKIPDDWALPTFDATTCGKDGLFKTARLEPGTYMIVAEAYVPERPEIREENGRRIQVIRSGIPLPAFVGAAKVTITDKSAPEPLRIEMRPPTTSKDTQGSVAENESAPPGSHAGEDRESDPQSAAASPARTNPQSTVRNPQSSESLVTSAATTPATLVGQSARTPKSADALLAELRAVLPEDWTCSLLNERTEIQIGGSTFESLFILEFTNPQVTFTFSPSAAPVHPNVRLYFLPVSEANRALVQRASETRPLTLLTIAETSDYIVVAPRTAEFVNSYSEVGPHLARSMAPLGRALESHWGRPADESVQHVLGLVGNAAGELTGVSGFAGQVVDDETGKPVKRFNIDFRPEPAHLMDGPFAVVTPPLIFFGGWFAFEGRSVTRVGIVIEWNGIPSWQPRQEIGGRVVADGYLPASLTPEPVTWPVRLTNLVVRLKRVGSSTLQSEMASPARTSPQSVIQSPQSSQSLVTLAATEWGQAVDNIALRLRADKPVWRTNEIPKFRFSIRNDGTDAVGWSHVRSRGQVEVDGSWYRWFTSMSSSQFTLDVVPGGRLDDLHLILGLEESLNARLIEAGISGQNEWRDSGGAALKLGPGKHTVRLAILATRDLIPLYLSNPATRVVSNPVEIEVTDGVNEPGKAAGSNPQSEIRNPQSSESLVTSAATEWGEPVEGVQVRLHAQRTRWGTNEPPQLLVDIANRGSARFDGSTNYSHWDLEVDGRWHAYALQSILYISGTAGPHLGQTSTNLLLSLDAAWFYFKSGGIPEWLKLLPGKHLIRARIHGRISNPLEIEISDVPETGSSRREEAPTERQRAEGRRQNGALQSALSSSPQTAIRWAALVAIGEIVSEPVEAPIGGTNLMTSRFDFKVGEVLKGTAPDEGTIPAGVYLRQLADAPPRLKKGDRCVLFLNPQGKWLAGERRTWWGTYPESEMEPSSSEMISTLRHLVATMPEPVPHAVQFARLMERHLPGYSLREGKTLVTPSGEEMDLAAATRGQWRGVTSVLPPAGSGAFDFPTYWRNAKLTALAPSLNLKVVTPQDAEEVARLILGLFKGWTSFENWTTKAEPSEHGWVITPEYVGPPSQVLYQGPLELILQNGVLKDVRQEAEMPPRRARLEIKDANVTEPGWGEPVEGLSVRLQSDKEVWYLANDAPVLRLSVRNLGSQALAVPESEELGELEVDGVWYTWSDKYFVAHKALAPGRQMENLAVLASSPTWRKDSTALFAGAGKHRIRFAVTARRGTANSGPTIRAVSNPVEVEFRRGVAPKEAAAPATNTPSTNAPSATASPARANPQSSESRVTSAATNDPSRPFVVKGRVTDEQGNGLEGVTITAHCGMGTLMATGETKSDAEGRYTLRFREGMSVQRDGQWVVGVQAATISPRKPGFFETNLHRGGDLLMADKLPAPGEDVGWKVDPAKVVLTNQPYELNFVMRPAATIVGQLLDVHDQPTGKHKLWINGDQLPPSSSVLAEVETDSKGRFRFENIPTGYTWRFNLEGGLRVETHFIQPVKHEIGLRVRMQDGKSVLDLCQDTIEGGGELSASSLEALLKQVHKGMTEADFRAILFSNRLQVSSFGIDSFVLADGKMYLISKGEKENVFVNFVNGGYSYVQRFRRGELQQPNEDKLRSCILKSDLVVIGEITAITVAGSDHVDVYGWSFKFKIAEVMKGNIQPGETIDTGISVNEPGVAMFEHFRPPRVIQGDALILFLNNLGTAANPRWARPDFECGALRATPSTLASVKSLAALSGGAGTGEDPIPPFRAKLVSPPVPPPARTVLDLRLAATTNIITPVSRLLTLNNEEIVEFPIRIENRSAQTLIASIPDRGYGGSQRPSDLAAATRRVNDAPAEWRTSEVYVLRELGTPDEAVIWQPGQSHELTLRMNCPRSGRLLPLIDADAPGKYSVRVSFAFKVGDHSEYFEFPELEIELRARRQDDTVPLRGLTKSLTFGTVIEREMGLSTNVSLPYLDLDSGDFVANRPPGDLASSSPGIYPNNSIRIGLDLVAVTVATNRWDSTPGEVLTELGSHGRDPGQVLGNSESRRTCFFETREGSIGVLQIVPVAGKTESVLVRYKLISQKATEFETSASETGVTLPVTLSNGARVELLGLSSHGLPFMRADGTWVWGRVFDQNGAGVSNAVAAGETAVELVFAIGGLKVNASDLPISSAQGILASERKFVRGAYWPDIKAVRTSVPAIAKTANILLVLNPAGRARIQIETDPPPDAPSPKLEPGEEGVIFKDVALRPGAKTKAKAVRTNATDQPAPPPRSSRREEAPTPSAK